MKIAREPTALFSKITPGTVFGLPDNSIYMKIYEMKVYGRETPVNAVNIIEGVLIYVPPGGKIIPLYNAKIIV